MSRTVKLTLEANVSGLVAGLKTGQKATNDFARETKKFVKTHQQDLQTLGDASAKVGAGAALGLGLVAKAAMGWESAWTGVLKTVDGTPAQLGEVEDGLRGLARVLPSSHTEIAAVAEAAGQLGVKTGDVVGFTKVMIDLGQSTNLSAEDAATSLARFSNIMGTSTKDVGRLGATLVGLGNNYATTESEIMAMSMRLAGAGRQIGLSEGQTMGLSAAMSSVGIEAEAGGTAMSLTMKRIGKAVDNGGSALDTFATTAGMTATQFAEKWKGDAAGGLQSFVLGLGKAGAAGESVNGILSELGITGIRESDALLRLSSAGELMGEAMKQGAMEYQAGTALLEEATKRYETAESKVSIAWNNIKDAAIDAGSVMLPVISQLSEGVAGLAQWFTSLPGPVKTLVMALGGLVAVGGLGFGAISKVARSAQDLSAAFANIAPAGGRARGAIGRVGKAAGLAAIAVTALSVAAEMITQKHTTKASDYADAVIKIAKAGEQAKASDFDSVFSSWDQMAGDTSDNIAGLSEAITRLANPEFGDGLNQFMDEAFAWTPLAKSDVTQVKERLGDLGEELGNIASGGNAEQAADAFRVLAAEFQNNDMSAQDALDTMPAYSEALKKIAADAGETVEPSELLQWALTGIAPAAVAAAQGLEEAGGVVGYVGNAAGETIPVTEDMAKALEGVGVSAEGSISGLSAFVDYLFASGLAVMSSRDAAFKWSDTLRDLGGEIDEILGKQGELGPALNKSATDFNKSTDTGKAANEKFTNTLREGLEVARTYAGDVSKSQKDVQKQLESTYKAGVKTAEGFDIPKKAAEALTRETMGIPEGVSIKSWMSDEAKRVAEEITGAVQEVPEQKKIKVLVTEEGSVPATQELIDDITGRTVATYVTDEGTVMEVQGGIDNIEGKTEFVLVDENGTATVVQQQINQVTGKTEYVTVDDAGTASDVQARINNISGKSVTINVGYNDPGFKGDGHSGRFATGGAIHGPGTSTSDSIPALLSNGEHVWTADEVRKAGGHAGLERMRGLAKAGLLPAFAKGGRVGWSRNWQAETKKDAASATQQRKAEEAKERAAQRAYDGIDGTKENRDAKKAAKRALDAAKKATARAKKAEAAAKREYEDAKGRTGRLKEDTRDLKTDLRRGTIRESVMSGNGMSVVDRLFDESRNQDLSKGQRANLAKVAKASEKQLLKLEKQAEKLAKQLDKANEKRDELFSAKEGVRNAINGSFDLGSTLGQKNAYGYDVAVNKGSLLSYGKQKAASAKKLSQIMGKLQKAGFRPELLQEVVAEWTASGTFEIANALDSMSKSEMGTMNDAYKFTDKYANSAGYRLTEAMHKGGLHAADGLVKGLEDKEADLNKAMWKLAKNMEKTLRKAWGIASPSKVMRGLMHHVGDGAVLGLDDKAPEVSDAMSAMVSEPKYGGWSVNGGSSSRSMSAPVMELSAADRALMSQFVMAAQSQPEMKLVVNGRQAGAIVQEGSKATGRLK